MDNSSTKELEVNEDTRSLAENAVESNLVEKSDLLTLKESQPDTQPVDSQEVLSSPENEAGENFWGVLVAVVPYLTGVNLSRDNYIIGRKKTSNICIPDNISKSCKYFSNISKQHCTIRLVPEGCYFKVYFEDHSSNGSFVNRKPVHKTSVELSNNDVISLGHQDNALFKIIFGESLKFPVRLRQRYHIKKLLGQGSFGVVHLAFCLRLKQRVAIKSVVQKRPEEMPNQRDAQTLLNHEGSLMLGCKHSSVIRILEVVITPENSMYLVMEYMEGGDLLQRLRMSGDKLDERTAKLYFMQLVSAVDYLHGKGIVHRDLKPENLLLASNETETLLKVSDFGLSKFLDEQTVMKTLCGTPLFVAPEVLNVARGRGYGRQCDLWSMGVILFICLTGRTPFPEKRGDVLAQITQGIVHAPNKLWDPISREARDLVFKLLTVNPAKRIKSCDVLQHLWLADQSVKRKMIQLYNEYENRMSSLSKRFPLERTELLEPEAKMPRLES